MTIIDKPDAVPQDGMETPTIGVEAVTSIASLPAVRVQADVRNLSLTVLTVLAVIFALHWGRAFFIPLMLGIMISYAFSPLVNWMQKWRIPRAIGAAVLLISIVGGTGSLVYSLSDDAVQLIETLPDAAKKFRKTLRKEWGTSSGSMEKMQKAAGQLESAANETITPATTTPRGVTRVLIEKPKLNITDHLWTGTVGAAVFAGQAVMVLFLTYFLLVSGDTFRRKLVKISGPTLSKKKITLRVLDEITAQIQRYLLVHIFTSILVGVATWLAFLWIGLEHAAIWGWLWGVWGLLLGVPIIMMIKAICDRVDDFKSVGELLGK